MTKKALFCFCSLAILLTACQPKTVNYNFYGPAARSLHPSMSMSLPGQRGFYQSEVKCRITCFSYNNKGALYPLPASALPPNSKQIYVKGFVMVPGKQDSQRICRPFGYGKADISAAPEFKDVCKVFVKACRNGDCWAGGN